MERKEHYKIHIVVEMKVWYSWYIINPTVRRERLLDKEYGYSTNVISLV